MFDESLCKNVLLIQLTRSWKCVSSAKKGEEQERRAVAAVRFRDNAVKAPIMFKLKLIDLSSGVSFANYYPTLHTPKLSCFLF